MEDFSEQMDTMNTGVIAGDVGFDALEALMNYYPTMLGNCLRVISTVTGQSVQEVRLEMEQDSGLSGILEISMKQLTASRDVIGSLLDSLGNSSEE